MTAQSSTARGSPRSSSTFTSGSSCPRAHRRGVGRAVRHPGLQGTVAAMTSRAADGLGGFLEWPRTNSPPRTWQGSTRPGCGWRAGWLGALGVDRQVQPDHRARPARHQGHGRRRGAPRVHRGRRARCLAPYDTYTALTHRYAARTPCESSRPSPTPPRPASGAGRSKAPTRCASSTSWSTTHLRPAPTPTAPTSTASTRPRSPPRSTATAAGHCWAWRQPTPGRAR